MEAYRNAQLAALQGEEQRAIELLNEVYDRGFRVYWRQFILYDPVISRLQGRVAFQQLVARFEEDMERQLEVANELLEVGP